MNMEQHLRLCKRCARQLKSERPDLGHCKRLDLAAREQGFRHFTVLRNVYNLIGPDQAPTRMALVRAGGDERDSPYRRVSASFEMRWSMGEAVSSG